MSTPSLPAMLQSLRTPLPPVRRPPGYLPGLAATALFSVLMPLVYLGLILGVGWLCWWHLTTNWFLLTTLGHGFYGLLLALLVYGGPVLAGGTMMAFMVRPLLIRASAAPESRVLRPEEAPDFVALVHGVADAVGAPRPAEIRLDSQVNASASFRNGFAGWIKGELTLTVGLPLLEGMNTREVAGILGHEFGHFAQGGGMRLSFLVRNQIYWFQRVVTHRDEWDLKLDRGAKESDIRIGVFLHLARFFVWASRMCLGGVARVSHLVCVFLLRAMEYDADRHEARIAGSEQFARTAHHLRRLGWAWQKANGEAARAWNDGALPRNFAAYVGHLEGGLDAETDGRLAEGVRAEERNLWATHPRDVDRVARAEAAREPGIFAHEEPCRDLFVDFSALSEACSDVYYAARIGERVDPSRYQSTEAILQSSREMALDCEAFRASVGTWAGVLFPLNFHGKEDAGDLPSLDAARQAVEDQRSAIDAASAAYDEAYAALREMGCYRSARAAGYEVGPHLAKFQGREPNLPEASAALQAALDPVHQLFLAGLPGARDRIGAVWEQHRRFASEPCFGAWQIDHTALSYLIQQDDNGKPERWNEIQRLLGRLKDALTAVEARFAGLPHLFAEREGISMGEYLLGGPVASLDDPNALFRQSGLALDRAAQLYTRLLGRLARVGGLVPEPAGR